MAKLYLIAVLHNQAMLFTDASFPDFMSIFSGIFQNKSMFYLTVPGPT